MNISIITLKAILRQLNLQMSDKAITKNERISKATLLKIRKNVASTGLSLSELLEKQESEIKELFQITKYEKTCKKSLISFTHLEMIKMDIKVCFNTEFELLNSYSNLLQKEEPKKVQVSGVGVFDTNGKILPLVSQYLSYQCKHEKIAIQSASTYGKNITYFLQYIRSREDYDINESDDVFLIIPTFVIQEYLSHLSRIGLSSSTIRNRDATLRAFFEFLCNPINILFVHRTDNPYQNGYLSKSPKRTRIESCTLDELSVLINSTQLERERILLQFLFDSGLRRSELPRVTLEDIDNAFRFNSEKFIAKTHDNPVSSEYLPLAVKGSKGRGNEIKPRWTLISISTLMRIQKYHASPLYKKYARRFKNPTTTPAFLNADGTAYTPVSINKLLERVSRRAIRNGLLNRMISPHKLRHGNAYAILQSNDLGSDYLDRLVIVQKNLGHNNLDTTQMYTSIPQEIYNAMCDENGEFLTRAEKMKRLTEETQLKIKIGEKK